ncbi:hypothetical protein TGAMA5MH_04045 [Trichoderma gamsii]|uniref:DUF2415 domain-containing protein n=1 Tax=Trichoderma gamsii TaxID=398673 RepID=A0A2K0TE22_9HYPO|nr:hypothetical protein TGAMA5MH_04045 [Trichoderma gamsii]
MRPNSLSLPLDCELSENSFCDGHDGEYSNHPNLHHCSQPDNENRLCCNQAQYALGNSTSDNMYFDQLETHIAEHSQGSSFYNAPVDGDSGSNQLPLEPPTNSFLNHSYGVAYTSAQHHLQMDDIFDQEMSDSDSDGDGGASVSHMNGVIGGNYMIEASTTYNQHYADGLADDEGEMDEDDEDEEYDEEYDEDDEDEMMSDEESQAPPTSVPSLAHYLHPSDQLPLPANMPQELLDEALNILLQNPLSADELSLDEDEEQMLHDPFPPPHMSNPNPSILGSENYGLVDFLRSWAYGNVPLMSLRLPRPGIRRVLKQANSGVERVHYRDLRANGCDMQGLDWDSMNTARYYAREIRRQTYRNYVNRPGSDIHIETKNKIPSTENFFRFYRMDVRRDISLAHFQLRSVLACPTRTQAFYPSVHGINVMNTATKKTTLAMDLRAFSGMTGPAISTLDAGCGLLMSGTFGGDYFLQSLSNEDRRNYSEGQISTNISGITNHIKIYKPRRSDSPAAAIASNDNRFRLMDLRTEKFTSTFTYPFALNCSAMSPDGRLRVVVGDDLNVLITNAETGEILQKLDGHRDYGFACDWSDNGWTVATGFQDKTIKIWDARRWQNSSGITSPIYTINTEMAGVRNLRFSPTGSGKPILAAAEEADYIHLIDAGTFRSKQTIDIFGEIGGVAFTNEGQNFNVLCCDAHRGGLLQFERCSYGVDEPVSAGQRRPLKGDEADNNNKNKNNNNDDDDNKYKDNGSSATWNDWQHSRPPPLMDGPSIF